MFKKSLSWLLITFVLATVSFADAQQPAKLPKIGWLALRPPSRVATAPSGRDLFWREFGALGYVQGKNVAFEYRSAENKLDRLPALADELIRLKVDVIIAPASSEIKAAKKATQSIPIGFFTRAKFKSPSIPLFQRERFGDSRRIDVQQQSESDR